MTVGRNVETNVAFVCFSHFSLFVVDSMVVYLFITCTLDRLVDVFVVVVES